MTPSLDFSYPWWLSYAHLSLAAVLMPIAVLTLLRGWPRAVQVVVALALSWAVLGAIGVYRFGANRVPPMPTAAFLPNGSGRVLDVGAGTGRSSIMVLRERPESRLVALDLFGASFTQHFGDGPRPEDRLAANLRGAGVDSRATIQAGDMLDLPFPDEDFDAVVSAYAMDHVGGDGARRALSEARRVLRPDGQFLLMLVHNDTWTTIAFGPMLVHSGVRGQAWWRQAVVDAGFTVVEEGTAPATMFFLLKR